MAALAVMNFTDGDGDTCYFFPQRRRRYSPFDSSALAESFQLLWVLSSLQFPKFLPNHTIMVAVAAALN